VKKNDAINFKKFIQVLSVFSQKGNPDEKMKIAFKIYDLKDDGFIDYEELFEVIKMMVGSNLKDRQLWQIVKKRWGRMILTKMVNYLTKNFQLL